MRLTFLALPAAAAAMLALAGCGSPHAVTAARHRPAIVEGSTYSPVPGAPAYSPAAGVTVTPAPAPGTTCASIAGALQQVVSDMNSQDADVAPLIADGEPLVPMEGLAAAAWVGGGSYALDLDAFMSATAVISEPTSPARLDGDVQGLRVSASALQIASTLGSATAIDAGLEAAWPSFQSDVTTVAGDCGLTISADWS